MIEGPCAEIPHFTWKY